MEIADNSYLVKVIVGNGKIEEYYVVAKSDLEALTVIQKRCVDVHGGKTSDYPLISIENGYLLPFPNGWVSSLHADF